MVRLDGQRGDGLIVCSSPALSTGSKALAAQPAARCVVHTQTQLLSRGPRYLNRTRQRRSCAAGGLKEHATAALECSVGENVGGLANHDVTTACVYATSFRSLRCVGTSGCWSKTPQSSWNCLRPTVYTKKTTFIMRCGIRLLICLPYTDSQRGKGGEPRTVTSKGPGYPQPRSGYET